MGKKIIKFIFLILVFIGIGSGLFITFKRDKIEKDDKKKIEDIFFNVQAKDAILTNFYTYGNSLNIEGKLSNISKDNFEGAKLIITDGNFEKSIRLDTKIEDKNLFFSTALINDAIELDKLDVGEYFVLFRLKLNNSSIPKLYFLTPESDISDIRYYSITKNGENKRIDIDIREKEINNKNYKYLSVKVVKDQKPENVYDFVIDSGHGGKDERRTFW